MPTYILVNGKKRSGKDYFAEMLQFQLKKLGKEVQIESFAGPIKEIISETMDISIAELDKMKNNSTPIYVPDYGPTSMSYRKITDARLVLQKFGTEAMKKWFGEDVWVKLLIDRTINSDVDFVIVPDFRFISENIPGGITVKIRNDDIEKNSTDNHRSENELNDFEFMYEIDNTGYSDITNDVQEFIKFMAKHQTKMELTNQNESF